jgi:hypothetical protein
MADRNRVGAMTGRSGFGRSDYAVSRDGQRFLVNTVDEEAGSAMTVVVEWPKSRNY